jgi:hypothetical protein
LHVVTNYYIYKYKSQSKAIELGLPDTPGLSNEIYNDVSNGRMAIVKHLANLNDFKVLQMGWIFDINFPRTFQIIAKRKYLEKIHFSLNNFDKADEILNVTRLFLERNLSDARSTDAIWQ